jgi:membrane protein DedA with SNARE-associated domain
MESLFLQYFSFWHPLGHLLIFFGLFVEGHVALIIIGFMVAGGTIGPVEAFASTLISTLIGDNLWYWVGVRLGKSSDNRKWRGYVERAVGRFDGMLQRRPGQALFFTKFIYGTYRAALLRIGMLNISPRRFWKLNVAASTAWIAVWGGLSYLIGKYFLRLKDYIHYIEVALVFVLVLVLFLEWSVSTYLSWRLRRRLLDSSAQLTAPKVEE